jgi:membrane protease YdiL (CAAX protease family)
MNDNWTGAEAAPSESSETGRIRSYVTWDIWDLVLGIVGSLVLIFILSLVVQGIVSVVETPAEGGGESAESYFASFVATILWDAGFVLLVLWMVARKGAGLINLGFRRPDTPSSTTTAWVIGGYFLLFGTVAIYNVLVSLFGLDFLEPSEQLPEDVFDSTAVIAIAGVAIVLAAPIAEETFFRGFLFGGLLRYLPMPVSALMSGAIFSLAHGNIGLIIPFSLVGAVLAWLYTKTNSLLTPILVHLLFNLTSYTILVFVPDAR